MNKKGKTKIVIGLLLLVILSTSIYILLPEKTKLVIGETNSKFYVWENDNWVLSATEYVNIFDGSTKMRSKSRDVSYQTINDITTITRTSLWKNNITTTDVYTFDSTTDDVELFPISHTVNILNAKNKILHFEYRNILYDGITRTAISPESFGHNMKIEWEETNNFMWAKLYQQKTASDKLIIRYRVSSNDETYSVRLFDPVAPVTQSSSIRTNITSICYQDIVDNNNQLEGWCNVTDVNVNNIIPYYEWFKNGVTYSSNYKWISNTSIISGLTTVGTSNTYETFYINNKLKLITGSWDGTFEGYDWSGSTWISNSSIISGLLDTGEKASPEAFYMGDSLKLIVGNYDGLWDGYQWNGSQWISNSSIISGLVDVGLYSSPTIFNMSNNLYLITGNAGGTYVGYHWDGSSWVLNSSISNGLIDTGSASSPEVFYDGNNFKLISNSGINFIIFNWNNSAWNEDSFSISGLGERGGYNPAIFNDSINLKLIESGRFSGRIGYQLKKISTYSEGIDMNLNNISILNISLIDEWIFSCRGYNGYNYSSWKNSTTVKIHNISFLVDGTSVTILTSPINKELGSVILNVSIDAYNRNVSSTSTSFGQYISCDNSSDKLYSISVNGNWIFNWTVNTDGTLTYDSSFLTIPYRCSNMSSIVRDYYYDETNSKHYTLCTNYNITVHNSTGSLLSVYDPINNYISITGNGSKLFLSKTSTHNLYVTNLSVENPVLLNNDELCQYVTYNQNDDTLWCSKFSTGALSHLYTNGSRINFEVANAVIGSLAFCGDKQYLYTNDGTNFYWYDISDNYVCIDDSALDFGNNYSCGLVSTQFDAQISSFQTTTLANGSSSTELFYNGPQNNSFDISVHQYDELNNFTFNMTGNYYNNTYPANLKIYVDNKLSNEISLIFNTSIFSTDEFNDTTTSKNVTLYGSNLLIPEYFKIPKNANVTSAYMSLKGFYTEGLYSGEHWNSYGTDKYPAGIATNGTIIWIINWLNKQIHQYDMSGNHISEPITTYGTAYGGGIAVYDNNYWLTSGGPLDYEGKIYKYYVNGSYITKWDTIASGNPRPMGIETNGTYIWTTDYTNTSVHKYDMVGNHISNWTTISENQYPYGIAQDGTYIWVSDASNNKVYKYNMDGTYTGVNWSTTTSNNRVRGLTTNGTYVWIIDMFGDEVYKYFSSNVATTNPWLDIGVLDAVTTWSYSGIFNTTSNVSNFKDEINAYLTTCTADSNSYCYVPIYLHSDTSGKIEMLDIEINYTYNVNPVTLDIDLIQTYLDNSINSTNLTITIENEKNGSMTISDINYDYLGGISSGDVIRAHSADYFCNISTTLKYVYSGWDYNFPPNIDYIEWYPWSPTAKNVTPFGQTNNNPIVNVTTYNYGTNLDFLIKMYGSNDCVTLTVDTDNTKTGGTVMVNNTYITLKTNQSFNSNFGIWIWADLTCSYTDWRLWSPNINFKTIPTI